MLTEKRAARDAAQVKFMPNVPNDSQSRVTTLDVLNDAVIKCRGNSITALAENDYEQLIVLLGELMDIVRDDENHLLTPLMEFVFGLIENYERKHIPELAKLG